MFYEPHRMHGVFSARDLTFFVEFCVAARDFLRGIVQCIVADFRAEIGPQWAHFTHVIVAGLKPWDNSKESATQQ